MKWSGTVCDKFSTLRLNALLSQVMRRIPILMLRFCRST
jgi:hypothetical protein